MPKPLRLLTIGHSYSTHASRRLPNEIARAANGRWDVLAVGPAYYQGNRKFGDLHPEHLIVEPDEIARIAGMPMYLSNNIHLAFWGDATRKLMREEFDVVHCWEEPFNPAAAQIARYASAKSAFIFYTFQNIEKRYPFPFNRVEENVLRRADAWIAGGNQVQSILSGRPTYASKPNRVLGLGVDVEQFQPDPEARIDVHKSLGWEADGTATVGFLGRFTEAKGIPLMLRTLDRISQPWRAIFMGSGELETRIEKWALQYPGRVAIKKNLSHSAVAKHLNGCDVLCAPSQTTPAWKEQFGRMLVEAFASGVMIVTSDSGEIPNVVGNSALVVPEKNEDSWFQALSLALSSPELRRSYSELGLARVRERFSWSVIARQHLEFFETVLETKRQEKATR